ncbi:hypothetical protein [Nostoc sp. CALU 1950]|uniref:hypothetical protein n=1 Tax=Nostoc sp. CALU 1950 TaxID=3104321 RepID=UPI003EBA40FA
MVIEDKIRNILSETESGFRKILSYELVKSDLTGKTYEVTFKEVISGVSGVDTTRVFILIKDLAT